MPGSYFSQEDEDRRCCYRKDGRDVGGEILMNKTGSPEGRGVVRQSFVEDRHRVMYDWRSSNLRFLIFCLHAAVFDVEMPDEASFKEL
jgi:hypothetical protein